MAAAKLPQNPTDEDSQTTIQWLKEQITLLRREVDRRQKEMAFFQWQLDHYQQRLDKLTGKGGKDDCQ